MKTIPTLICLLIITAPLYGQSTHLNLDDDRLAIDGYDPVAYFKQGKAIEGKSSIVVVYGGARYWFSTEENKKLFIASPAQYMPQYGGWCAYAMGAKGEKVTVDPETFKILDGKLYLFYNRFFNNTLEDWNENEKELKTNADRNWTRIITE